MIVVSEQYGYKNPLPIDNIDKYSDILNNKSYCRSIQRGDNKTYCYKIDHFPDVENPYRLEASYFVGIDWVVENELAIYIKPKMSDTSTEINFLKMLFDILKESENYNYLDQLCEIDFNKPTITIEQRQDILTPLLIIQYLNILKKIVQKGLRKTYYPITKNLNAKIKGRILINETIKKNHFNNKMLYNCCRFSEFGVNSIENKVLKKALEFSISALKNLKGIDTSYLNEMLNYIQPAFENVDSKVSIEELKNIKPNNFYKEYIQALIFARHILKRYGYNISSVNSLSVKTPPFWIDMSKLFELYIFSKLKERFNKSKEVTYHKKFNYLEPDFIIKTYDGLLKMVVDAKYKPQYQNGKVNVDDIRQISGYARLKKIYSFLEIEEKTVIDCLVIYSSQSAGRKDFIADNFQLEEEKEYNRFFKIGIELPENVFEGMTT